MVKKRLCTVAKVFSPGRKQGVEGRARGSWNEDVACLLPAMDPSQGATEVAMLVNVAGLILFKVRFKGLALLGAMRVGGERCYPEEVSCRVQGGGSYGRTRIIPSSH